MRGRLAGRAGPLEMTIFDGHLRCDQAGIPVDRDLQIAACCAWPFAEFAGDQIAGFERMARGVDIVAVGGPGGGERFRLALLQRAYVGRGSRADRGELLVVRFGTGRGVGGDSARCERDGNQTGNVRNKRMQDMNPLPENRR